MKRYRVRPPEVRAKQWWDGENPGEFMEELPRGTFAYTPGGNGERATMQIFGVTMRHQDWLVKDGDAFAVMSNDEFRKKYELSPGQEG